MIKINKIHTIDTEFALRLLCLVTAFFIQYARQNSDCGYFL